MRFSIFSLIAFWALNAQAVSVTSLNIEWYGRGGTIRGAAADEHRDETIREFLADYIPHTDVFVFQEITEPRMLMASLNDLDCFTYDMPNNRHQFVVMCSKRGILKKQSVNHNVRLGRNGLRAALIGEYELVQGERFKVIGLHLKAGWKDTQTRIGQIVQLKESLKSNIPTLIIGDMNTYTADRTNLELDDVVLMSSQISEFKEAFNSFPTYLGFGGRIFDRAWGRGLDNMNADVYGPCNVVSTSTPYVLKDHYEKFVSDHCALQVNFEL